MSVQDTIASSPPTLFELLAREWNIGVGIQSLIFNARQTAVAYGLDNGSVAIAYVSDNDPAQERVHVSAENGRQTIKPRVKSPKPLVMVEVENTGPIRLGTFGATDFVAGSDKGPLYRITTAGDKSDIAMEMHYPVSAMDDCRIGGRFACASGSIVEIFDHADMAVERQFEAGKSITAIGFSPDGKLLAGAHEQGLTVWPVRGKIQDGREISFGGGPSRICWSPDSRWIAAPLVDGGFQFSSLQDGRTFALTEYPSPVTSVDWSKEADALVTSGAFRVTAWSMKQPPIEDAASGALETGKTGFVPISAVSCHPDRDLVVAGYDNGTISIMQIGGRDEMVLSAENHGAVTGLAWSRDAGHIACGTDKGLAALISVPVQMFK